MQYRLHQALMALCAMMVSLSAAALPSSYYTDSSVLSSGHWVKIKVSKTGIQQITHEQLAEWGFNDPSKVTVHGFGGVVGTNEYIGADLPDDLASQPVIYTADRLLFYGEANWRNTLMYWDLADGNPIPGVERNNFSDCAYYFITDSQPVTAIEKLPYVATTKELDYHYCISTFEEEYDNPFHVGQHYFGHNFIEEESQTLSFDLVDRNLDGNMGDYVAMRYITVGVGKSPQLLMTYTSRLGTSVSSKYVSMPQTADNEYYSINTAGSADRSYLLTRLTGSVNNFSVTFKKNASDFTFAAIDKVSFLYPRYNNLNNAASLLMQFDTVEPATGVVVSNATPNTVVWNVDQAYGIKQYNTVYDYTTKQLRFAIAKGYEITPENGCWRAIVINPDKNHHAVEWAGEVESQNIHAMSTPDLIIISSDLCYDQAQRLAQIHRDLLGHEVLVLRQDEIYNEFSSGTPSAWGIRRMVKMFADRDPSRALSVLLFGGGSFDNAGLTDYSKANRRNGALLPTYGAVDLELARTGTKSYCFDGYFGITADTKAGTVMHSQPLDVNVGRIPATKVTDAITSVDKIHDYLTNIPDVDITHRMLVVTDSGNENSHMNNGENVASLIDQYAPGTTVIKAYNSIYPLNGVDAADLRASITQALKTGVSYFNYNGHGSPRGFGANNLWNILMVNNTDYTFYPFAMLATCDAFDFDRLSENIAESMIFKNHGGMIGIIGASRTVYLVRNQELNNQVSIAYAQADEATTTGDILRLGRNAVIEIFPLSNDMHVNTSCFNLCGDPALPVFASKDRIAVTAINDEVYSATADYTVAPLTPNTITGRITATTDLTGATDTDFNGKVILTVYESPVVRTTRAEGTSPSVNIDTDEDILGQYTGKVDNGEFSISFTLPVQARLGDTNRITLLAYDEALDGTFPAIAKGYMTNVKSDFYLSPEASDDTTAPEISALYINGPEFASGDVVGGEFTVYATIEPDESGLRTSAATIGGQAKLLIDSSRTVPVIGTAMSIDAEGRVYVTVPVSSITDGRHILELIVSDNVGNFASRSIEFVVVNTPANVAITVSASDDEADKYAPCRTQAVIDLEHNFASEPAGRLIIEDAMGNTVLSVNNCRFPYTWDLIDGATGELVPDGVYSVYAILSAGMQYGATPKADIVVLQK